MVRGMTMKHGRGRLIAAFFCLSVCFWIIPGKAAEQWVDTFLARTEIRTLLQKLNHDLLSHDSATLTLDSWCTDRKLAPGQKIVAERVPGADKPVTSAQRKLLKAGPTEPVRYRHVRLKCGDLVLSEADNWYVPARLTPDMNRQLDNSDIAFGRVAQPLNFHRQNLSARFLWDPLPPGWKMKSTRLKDIGLLKIPPHVLEHRAVLILPDGKPISEVIETYTSATLKFTPPAK